jgi:hypothetical protein
MMAGPLFSGTITRPTGQRAQTANSPQSGCGFPR